MEVVDAKCPRCGKDKIPNDMGAKRFPGNRSWADHWFYQCDESPWTF